MSPARPVADALQEILCLARLYLSEGEAARLVVWLAHRVGRNPALAGDRPEIERHWLAEDEREALARWMLARAAHRRWCPSGRSGDRSGGRDSASGRG